MSTDYTVARPRVVCPICKRKVGRNGYSPRKLARHNDRPGHQCKGTGMEIAIEARPEVRDG